MDKCIYTGAERMGGVKVQNEFEGVFRDFVTEFGGEVLPERLDGKSAY
jgi:hypothetical protein